MTPCSLVIPVRDRAALTLSCLDGLGERLPEVEAIVVDDGSGDRTREILEAFSERLTVVTLAQSAGFAAACNAGVARARGDWILFLNNDTIGIGSWLETLIEYASARPTAGIVGAKLLFPDNTIQHAGVALNSNLLPFHIYAGFPADHPAVSRSREFAAVTGACMLVRRDLFEEVGGFDEGFLNCYEDIDLCFKIRALGASVHFCAEAQLYHLESSTRDPLDGHVDAAARFIDRWRDSIVPDHLTYYLEDGLIDVSYQVAANGLTVSVKPELGVGVTGTEHGDVERLLARRVEQIAELRREARELRLELASTRPSVLRFCGDGSPQVGVQATGEVRRHEENLIDLLSSKLAPLRLAPVTTRSATVNILHSTFRREIRFAGHASVAALAGRLAERGVAVRLVVLDDAGDGVELPAGVEFFDATNRAVPLPVGVGDLFVATSVWGAHVADAAATELGRGRFVFLIQEDETLFYPSGSFSAYAQRAYELEHLALFATESLRAWFERERRSVFGAGQNADHVLTFRNAIVDPGRPSAWALAGRGSRRLLMYARPGATEARNLFEVGLLGLRRALAEGVFTGSWEFTGVGAPAAAEMALPGGRLLRILERQEPARYRAILRAHDVGLSLQNSPHPSLVPLEMAAAGMPVVTSTFGTKDADALAAISGNLVACEPSIDGVADGLRRAVARLSDIDHRVASAAFDWPRTAKEAFPDDLLDRLLAMSGFADRDAR